jgi:quinol monooxygenase YgiN
MWAQLISTRLKPGTDSELQKLFDLIRDSEQPGSGLLRSTAFRDTSDPSRLHIIVVFEDESKARARESDPRRQDVLAQIRATMAAIFDGPPEFADLTVINDFTPLSTSRID